MDTLSSDRYLQLVEDTRGMVLEYASQEWPVTKRSHGVEVSTHTLPNHKCKVYKAVGVLDMSPSDVFQYVGLVPGQIDSTKRKLLKIVKSWEVLRQVNENVFILRTVSKSLGGGVISSREYFDLVGSFTDDHQGFYMVCATGIDYPYPVDDKSVRGWNYSTGLLCYPVAGDAKKTKLVYLLHTDLKGKIPTKIVEAALPDTQVSYFTNLRNAIKETQSDSKK